MICDCLYWYPVLIKCSLCSFSLPFLFPCWLPFSLPFNSLTWFCPFIVDPFIYPNLLFSSVFIVLGFHFYPSYLFLFWPWDIVLTACRPRRPWCWFVRTFPCSIHSSTRPHSHDASRGRSGFGSEPRHHQSHMGRQLAAQEPENHGCALLHSALEDQHTSEHQV